VVRLELKNNATCRLLIAQPSSGKELLGELYAINPVYAFRLRRKSPQEPWVLARYHLSDDNKQTEIEAELLGGGTVLSALTYLYMNDLQQIVSSSTFRIREASMIEGQGGSLVRIDFDNTHSVSEKPFVAVQSGQFSLDPSRWWCLVGFDVRTKHPGAEGRITASLESIPSAAGPPIPKRVTQREEVNREGSGLMVFDSATQFELREINPPPPDEDFRLTAFGIPEPPGIEWKRPTPWWFWVAGGGIVLIGFGALFYWLKARSARSTG
jgi:hypothetical protein